MIDLAKPIDLQSIETCPNPFGDDLTANKVAVELIAVKNPQVTCIRQNVKTSRTKVQTSASSLALALATG